MSETERQPDKDQERIKKLLSSLPKIQATDDFEIRLQAKIANGIHNKGLIHYLLSHPVPSFAYSLLIIVVLGVLWYSSIKYFQEEVPVVIEPNESPVSIPEGTLSQPAEKNKKEGPRVDYKVELQSQGVRRDQPQIVIPRVEDAASAGVSSPLKVEQQLDGNKEGQRSGEGVPTKSAQEEMRQRNSNIEMRAAPALKQRTLKETDLLDRRGETVSRQDTSALEDSLKTDSLRQEKKRLLQQRQKDKRQKPR
jgi:hypothetical protein